jgi:hypothetical protein
MENLDAQRQTQLQVADPTFLPLFEAPPALVPIQRASLESSVHLFCFCLRQSKRAKEKSCFVSAFRSDLLSI